MYEVIYVLDLTCMRDTFVNNSNLDACKYLDKYYLTRLYFQRSSTCSHEDESELKPPLSLQLNGDKKPYRSPV